MAVLFGGNKNFKIQAGKRNYSKDARHPREVTMKVDPRPCGGILVLGRGLEGFELPVEGSRLVVQGF